MKDIPENSIGKIAKNISFLKEEIRTVCSRKCINPHNIKIIAASKYADAQQILDASKNGIKYFGENRAEELQKKQEIIKDRVIWHFIGHLQSRKTKIVVPIAELIHSIDSMKLLEKVNEAAFLSNKIQKVLLEINISQECSKFGLFPDEIDYFLKNSMNFTNISITGLMTMAPLTENFELIRKIFSDLRSMMEENKQRYPILPLNELSMGMSNDYKIAIQEGATMIRIGSLIFL